MDDKDQLTVAFCNVAAKELPRACGEFEEDCSTRLDGTFLREEQRRQH